jgi:hypothetical protein
VHLLIDALRDHNRVIRLEPVSLSLLALITWTQKHLDGLVDPVEATVAGKAFFDLSRSVLRKARGADQRD